MGLPELQDGAESKQKAEYITHTLSKRGKSDYIELTYKRLDGPNPGAENKTGNFVAKLSQESKDLIKAKGEFVVVKTKEGNFWPLTGVLSMDTYVAKAPSTFQKGTYSGGSTKSSGSTFNNAGIKVGAVLHDAVALVSHGRYDGKSQTSLQAVKEIAEELLNLSYELEANVNAGKYEPKTKVELALKALEKTVIKKEIIEHEDTLDNIDF